MIDVTRLNQSFRARNGGDWDSARKKLSAWEQHNRLIENRKEAALERTTEAQRVLHTLRTILLTGIEPDPTLDWEQLKIRKPFPTSAPATPIFEPDPSPKVLPPAPDPSNWEYRPKLSFFDHLITSRKAMRLSEARDRFDVDMKVWRDRCAALSDEGRFQLEATRTTNAKLQEEYVQAVHEWEQAKLGYYEEQERQHAGIDGLHRRYDSKSPDAVVEYCERVLSNSDYPECIPREFDFDFIEETGVLLVACKLPAPADLPKLAEVKYTKTTDTLSEKFLSETQATRLYDDVLYQITLRTIHELFRSDSGRAISTVVLNGIVTSIDRSTGNEVTACVLSVQASRDPFLAINLAQVDPKACFRQLKGVGSSKLRSLTAIAPIVELRRDDRHLSRPTMLRIGAHRQPKAHGRRKTLRVSL